MDKETKQKLRDGRDALQDNILPDKWEVIELYDVIQSQENKLMAIEDILKQIPKEHCTPFMKEKIKAMFEIIKG